MQEKQTASAPDWTKGTKKAPSEALRCGIPVPPPAQSAGAVGDSGPQYPGGLKGPLRQLQEFSGPLHLLLNEGVSDLFGDAAFIPVFQNGNGKFSGSAHQVAHLC